MARATGIPDIPEETRQAIALYLADWSACGRIKRGAASAAAKRFGCCRQQASKFFKERLKYLPTAKRGRPSAQVDTTRIARRVARVFATPLRRRWTLRALAHSAYIPKTTLLRYMSKQFVKRVTVRVKPPLSAEHKRRHKVIFLAAVARLRYDNHRKCHFDGKIGIWPIVEETVTLRTSVNRPKGTVITKCIAVSREVYTKMLIDRVFPAVRAVWPGGKRRAIFVQQDNAGPHVVEYDPVVAAAGVQYVIKHHGKNDYKF
ncbi:hypothetical protein F442_17392 [Phytophthora nicotianae P10297]|uniref:Transposase Tc1-like domain-containing protein n=1 Tax=Phytophthora nicotianae P10297 TaxID=1317064 RepID=W2YGU9_PHYNI|nr:hypothetical protein F442_17392 [Phytophthora nicotianae P10297]